MTPALPDPTALASAVSARDRLALAQALNLLDDRRPAGRPRATFPDGAAPVRQTIAHTTPNQTVSRICFIAGSLLMSIKGMSLPRFRALLGELVDFLAGERVDAAGLYLGLTSAAALRARSR